MTKEKLLAAIRELPRETQWEIRDAIPKRPRGRPRVVGPTPDFFMKLEAKEFFDALPFDMSEMEKFRAVKKAVPGLGWGALERLCRNEDSRFRRMRARMAGT